MSDSIREKLGIDEDDFVFLSIISISLLIIFVLMFMPFLIQNPVLSLAGLGFVLVVGSSVNLIRKYLEVRKLEAQPSPEELPKRQYMKNENLDIQEYEQKYEKLKEIEEEEV